MNVSFSFDASGRSVTIHYASEPSLDEWSETMLAAMNDPRFHLGIKILLDRHLVGTPSPEFVHGVAEFVGRHRAILKRCPGAILVGGKGAFGMARMGQALTQFHGVTFEILETAEAAEAWLAK